MRLTSSRVQAAAQINCAAWSLSRMKPLTALEYPDIWRAKNSALNRNGGVSISSQVMVSAFNIYAESSYPQKTLRAQSVVIGGNLNLKDVPLEDFVPSRASLRHMYESLSFNELEKAFNGQAVNVGLINMIKIRKKLSSCYNDRFLKQCNLLVSGE